MGKAAHKRGRLVNLHSRRDAEEKLRLNSLLFVLAPRTSGPSLGGTAKNDNP